MNDIPGMAIILAAGEGKRMKSDLPKVLLEVAGAPLLSHVAAAARESGAERLVVVVGKGAEHVRARFGPQGWEFVDQMERLGTGDAVRRAKRQLSEFDGEVLVLAGDAPVIRGETLRRLREAHREAGAAVTVLTAELDDPEGYGRIVRENGSGAFVGIVEHRDATPEQLAIAEVNSSIYCFDAAALRSVLDRFSRDNAQQEMYLTDAVGLLRGDGKTVAAVLAATPEEILGVNTPADLEKVREALDGRDSASAPGAK